MAFPLNVCFLGLFGCFMIKGSQLQTGTRARTRTVSVRTHFCLSLLSTAINIRPRHIKRSPNIKRLGRWSQSAISVSGLQEHAPELSLNTLKHQFLLYFLTVPQRIDLDPKHLFRVRWADAGQMLCVPSNENHPDHIAARFTLLEASEAAEAWTAALDGPRGVCD